ncbi:MAG: tRNA pseudouridine(38-40) synthase TruA [Clostridiales bacterium]|nr:tRNA pseudouridine(38-40) synthase TruA [Clostridiales bacterium]
MRNLRLKLSFDGAAYHGWQIQSNAVTVQGTVEEAVKKIFGSHLTVYGCSRTDSGVHANEYFCNFKTENSAIPAENAVKALNGILPPDIAVLQCNEAAPEFHSRYDCKSKEYIYKIWNSSIKNPFFANRAYQYKYKLDEVNLNEAAKSYIGTYDWSAFCASGSSVKSTVRTVINAEVLRQGDFVIFKVEADGFLYNMVRIMVGTLIYVNEGKIDKSSIKDIILSGDRDNAGFTAPPEGLYLNRVEY